MCNCIIINVASIQGYIGKSEKFVDLANSSFIMSELMKYIGLKQNFGELIVPYIDKEEEYNYVQAFPNTIIIKAKKRIDNLSSLIDTLKKDFFNESIKNFPISLSNDEKKEIYDIPEIYVAQAEGENYKIAYNKALRFLKARKNTRLFRDTRKNSSSIKIYNKDFNELKNHNTRVCRLCGEKIGKIVEEQRDENNKQYTKIKTLCFPCYFKRNYPNNNDRSKLRINAYPSLTEIALEDWIDKKSDTINKLKKAIDKIINKTDEEILFKGKNESKYLDKLNQEEKNILSKLKENEEIQSEYYAFIKADIDNLGIWISGKYYEGNEFLDYQKKISCIIVEFTKTVLEKLKNKCHFIYAGGDDMLILTSLGNIIKVIECLYSTINDIQIKRKNNTDLFLKDKITISTAVVLAHHKTPLDFVLSMIRRKLENIKDEYDYYQDDYDITKNSISLTYLTGGSKQVTFTSTYEDSVLYDIKNLKEAFHKGLSRSVAIDIENKIMPLICKNTRFKDFDMILDYIRRILSKKALFKEIEIIEQENKLYIKNIEDILKRTLMRKRRKENENSIEVDNLINLLSICKFLSSKTEMDGGLYG